MKRWDIFCKIVDNYGDIGVCWRLARQLQVEHGLQIRLIIDDLAAAQKIISGLNIAENVQVCADITILKWLFVDISDDKNHDKNPTDFNQAADVVIEAFACELPPAYLAAMVRKKSKWVNLEYLSAENWVDDFHGKPSPQSFINAANNLTRYFYFPGFTQHAGGLIREQHLIEQNQSFINNTQAQNAFWQQLKVANFNAISVSLFCYPHAPIHHLLNAFANGDTLINCYVPATSILPPVASFFGKKSTTVNDNLQYKNLQVQILPFLSQHDYDKLLCACDLNFVRGEDSWLRAIWAGKPFIWQPYLQAENAHIKKLDAFLDLFYADFDAKYLVGAAHHAWVTGAPISDVWQNYLANLEAIKNETQLQALQLSKQHDLSTKLVAFCNNL